VRGLKIVMAVMGVFIIGGFVFLGTEVYRRMTDPARGAEERAAAALPATAGLALPSGTRLGDPVAVGNRVVFRATVPDQGDRLYVIDPRTGVVSMLVGSAVETAVPR